MKILLISLFVFFVALAIIQENTVGQSEEHRPFCTDTDNGVNLTFQGSTTMSDGERFQSLNDTCNYQNFSIVNEHFCSSETIETKQFSCPDIFGESFRCFDGYCKEVCRDSDGGFNINDYGEVSTVGTTVEKDRCTAEGRLIENFCKVTEEQNYLEGSSLVGTCQEFGAPKDYYCKEGACVKNESYSSEAICKDSDSGIARYQKGKVVIANLELEDFCDDNLLKEYYCGPYGEPLTSNEFCSDRNEICYDGACISYDSVFVPKEKEPQSDIKSINLRTDSRMFGPKMTDTSVGIIYPYVGNARPKELNPDNGVLSDLDPWECEIIFEKDPKVRKIDFYIKSSEGKPMFSGEAQCKSDGICTGIVPREAVPRGEEVKCTVSVNGVEKESNMIKVAKLLFILIQDFSLDDNGNEAYLESFDKQFDFFIRRTHLQDGDYKLIKRARGECSGEELAIEDNKIRGRKTSFSKDLTECADKLGELWSYEDTPIYTKPGYGGGQTVGGTISIFSDNIITFSHETGHRFANFAEEYDYRIYKSEVDGGWAKKFIGEYPVCCNDYENSDNPYYTSLTEIIYKKYFTVEYITSCDESVEGRCVPTSESCGDGEIDKISFKSNCENGKKCCADRIKTGNNCYPPEYHIPERGDSNNCAGHPLNQDGSKLFIYEALQTGKKPKPDINAKYRSIMGHGIFLGRSGFNPENLIFPQVEGGLPWPLKAGVAS